MSQPDYTLAPPSPSAGLRPARTWMDLAAWTRTAILALAVALIAGEAAARIDDWLFADTPIFSNPDRAQDLLVRDEWGVRGRPNGHYRRWQLNSFGFSSPEISAEPKGRRIMVLGASETFGLYETKGHDYPAQLAHELAKRGSGDVEVVNAAVAGMALPSMTAYWDAWASRFKPQTVLIYPSSHFYLDIEVPRAPAPAPADQPIERSDRQSRLMMRLQDYVRQIPLVRNVRSWLAKRSALAGKPPDYLFKGAPRDRIIAFTQAVEQLGEAVERQGARPVLITHALKMPHDLSAADRAELERFRVFFPRATPETFPAFSEDARQALIELGRRRGWQVIDAAGSLSGHRELFADAVHFNDEGSRRMANLLADALMPKLSAPRGGH